MPYVLIINRAKNRQMRKTHSPVVFLRSTITPCQHALLGGWREDFTSPQELLLQLLLPSQPLLESQRCKASTSQSTSHIDD